MSFTTRQTKNLRCEYIGETQRGRFTPLESDLEPYQVKCRAEKGCLTADNFSAKPTDWDGCDTLDRVCKLNKCAIDQTIPLPTPIEIYGYDSEWGRTSQWKIVITKIHTIKDA